MLPVQFAWISHTILCYFSVLHMIRAAGHLFVILITCIQIAWTALRRPAKKLLREQILSHQKQMKK
ncbi:hypothetical protein LINGRAHAP2_LOCUS7847 [Linum grandiflorum]